MTVWMQLGVWEYSTDPDGTYDMHCPMTSPVRIPVPYQMTPHDVNIGGFSRRMVLFGMVPMIKAQPLDWNQRIRAEMLELGLL